MFSLFHRKKVPGTPAPAAPPLTVGLLRAQPAAALLAIPRRQRLLAHIWQRTALSRAQFAQLYRAPFERYAALVQQFPASESHHHSCAGGMLDHGLEIVAFALKLRQAHLLPAGAPPEAQAAQADAWTAGVAYAALLHDIGKIAVDLHVEYADGTHWHPWHGPLSRPYRFRYRKDRAYRLHGAATGLLYTHVLDGPILDWLSGYPDLWSALLYVLAGQYEHAGVLGELVIQADRASVAQDLGGNLAKVTEAPKQALQRKLLEGLRYLVREVLKLNQPEASDGWLTDEALWLVSKTVCDKLRAHLLSQGIEGVPASNSAVFDVLQEHGIVQGTPEGKAIWKASITSPSGWSHAFTFIRLSPALFWEPAERPSPFQGTVRVEINTDATHESADERSKVLSSMDARSPVPALATAAVPPIALDDATESIISLLDIGPSGAASGAIENANDASHAARLAVPVAEHTQGDTTGHEDAGGFMDWLRSSIQIRRLKINDAHALVHTVDDTVFLVSPGIFQRYVQEYPQLMQMPKPKDAPAWVSTQKEFEKLKLHRKQPTGLNIWTCEVAGPRKTRRLHGYLLRDAHALFTDPPPDNPYLKLLSQQAETHTTAG